jgi:hypothetical protein
LEREIKPGMKKEDRGEEIFRILCEVEKEWFREKYKGNFGEGGKWVYRALG